MSNDNNDNKESSLINTLIHYFMRKEKLIRQTTSLRLNRKIQNDFFWACKRLGLLNRGRHTNLAIEALMQAVIEEAKMVPPIVQTTLIAKKDLPSRVLSLPQRLKVVSIKRDFGNILDAYEKKIGHETFRESRFRELLPRAITIYEETRDPELKCLLEKAEQFVSGGKNDLSPPHP